MIGQEKLLNQIDTLIASDLPRFIMLVGQKGSGKKLICKEISKKLNYPIVSIGTGVDEIREVIVNSYRNTEPVIYVIADTDKMSVPAKNALLKVTEEPPQKAYFIMTVTDKNNMLNTLISRACVLQMDDYSVSELREYLNLKYNVSSFCEDLIRFITMSCYVPQDIDILMSYDAKEFQNFVEKICVNLHQVSAANSFKFEQKLALKKDEDKWDVLLTLQALKTCYLFYYMQVEETGYFKAYKCVSDTINEIRYKNSANKQYCLDQMVLNIRKCWR